MNIPGGKLMALMAMAEQMSKKSAPPQRPGAWGHMNAAPMERGQMMARQDQLNNMAQHEAQPMRQQQGQAMSAREVVAKHELSQAVNRGGGEEHTMAAIKRLPQGALASLLQNRAPAHELETRAMSQRQKIHDPFQMGDGQQMMAASVGEKHRNLMNPYESTQWLGLPHDAARTGPPIMIPGAKRLRGPQYR